MLGSSVRTSGFPGRSPVLSSQRMKAQEVSKRYAELKYISTLALQQSSGDVPLSVLAAV